MDADIVDTPKIELGDAAAAVASSIGDLTGIIDRAGFDPAVHAVNTDGTPKLRGDGTFAKKRGRKSGQSVNSPLQPGAGIIAQTPDSRGTISNDEAARQVCNAMVGVAVAVIGPEWAPVDKAEAKGLETAFKNYFDAKGQINLPPEVGLALAVGAYGLSRMGHESTQTFIARSLRKVKDAGLWVWRKIGG